MHRLIVATLLIFTVPHAAQAAEPFTRMVGDPAAARAFDYCGWARDVAGESPVVPAKEDLRDAEATMEESIAAGALMEAGARVALVAPTDECEVIFAKGERRFESLLKANRRQVGKQAKYKRARKGEIAAVQASINDLWREDQAARLTYVALQTSETTGELYWARQLSVARSKRVDGRAAAHMEKLLETWDWIDRTRFGSRIPDHAWILVQHADDHPEFQELVLQRMKPYLASGGIKPANYAYLWDRVAVNQGRKQRYGTQPIWECRDGGLDLQPLAEAETVNARRAELKMNTVKEGLAEMESYFCK